MPHSMAFSTYNAEPQSWSRSITKAPHYHNIAAQPIARPAAAAAAAARRGVLMRLLLVAALAAAPSRAQAACSAPAATLSTSCGGQCDEHVPCLVSASDCSVECFPAAYDSWGLDFLVPFGSYRSASEVAARAQVTDEVFDAQVAALSNDTDGRAAANNDELTELGTLDIGSTTGMAVYGGSSTTGWVRGKVAGVRISDDGTFVANASSLTLLSLENLELGPDLGDEFATKVPTSLTELYLRNNALESFSLSSLPNLRILSLAENYLTTFEVELPSLGVLYLTNNSFSAIPESVYSLPRLYAFYMSGNTLANATITQEQFDFLAGLDTLDLTTADFATTAISDCPSDSMKTLRGLTFCISELMATSSSSSSSPSSTSSSSASSQASSASPSSSSSSNTGIAVGAAIAGVVVLGVAIAIVLWIRRRKRNAEDKGTTGTIHSNLESNATTAASGSRGTGRNRSIQISLWSDAELMAVQVQIEDIEDVRQLGSGAFGVVWLVRFRSSQLLASKRLLPSSSSDSDDLVRVHDLLTEIKLNARLDHPAIVRFRGAAWHFQRDLQALFEFMDGGDLMDYLHSRRPTPRGSTGAGGSGTGSWTREKLLMAINVADALVYVHSFSPPIVHRDLKSKNILLNASESNGVVAKVADFGAARPKSVHATMTAGVGTGRWVAPEVLAGQNDYGQLADVYSLGVVLTELDTHVLPYDDFGSPVMPLVAVLQLVAAGSARPTLRSDCPGSLRSLIARCLSFESGERPSAPEVAYALRTIRRDLGW